MKKHMNFNVYCSTVYKVRTWKQPKVSINREIDKDDVVHIHDGILLSLRKEWNCAICRDMDGPRDCHTE